MDLNENVTMSQQYVSQVRRSCRAGDASQTRSLHTHCTSNEYRYYIGNIHKLRGKMTPEPGHIVQLWSEALQGKCHRVLLFLNFNLKNTKSFKYKYD